MRPKIKISDFTYALPSERIAKYPVEKRDSSKLLVYTPGHPIGDDIFLNLSEHLQSGSLLVFNDTKVVPARLFFRKPTGALIEILCLTPYKPAEYALSFASVGSCEWLSVIGNSKRWKGGELFFAGDSSTEPLNLRAQLVEKNGTSDSIVRFLWDGDYTFSEVLGLCGMVPIPPYLNRDSQEIDKSRYQTIYAKFEGSVAAPTAGLHFTREVLQSLDSKGIAMGNICLHVGAGTFVPVKSRYIAEHTMHSEPFSVSRDFLCTLLTHLKDHRVVAVGTTSVRTIESLYYVGVHCIEEGEPLPVGQWEPYEREFKYTTEQAIEAIVDYIDSNSLKSLTTSTSVIILPGFTFRATDALITNFHQPQSTLLLLIAALIGESWRDIYAHALENGYRFLSYGDSSLLFR